MSDDATEKKEQIDLASIDIAKVKAGLAAKAAEKKEAAKTLQDMVKELAELILQARENNHTYSDIAEWLNGMGVPISASTLTLYMRQITPPKKPRKPRKKTDSGGDAGGDAGGNAAGGNTGNKTGGNKSGGKTGSRKNNNQTDQPGNEDTGGGTDSAGFDVDLDYTP